MSLPVRTSRHGSAKTQPTHRSRKAIYILIVLLSLFLLGTVIVLSSVSYYLAIPDYSNLTELEVGWRPSDAIPTLKYSPPGTAKQHKREESEAVADSVEEDVPMTSVVDDDAVFPDESSEWDVDGPGTGGYWMQKDWDGRVEGTSDWTRLYNVSTRHGENMPRIIHQTWKDDTLPVKWRKPWKECREGMPD